MLDLTHSTSVAKKRRTGAVGSTQNVCDREHILSRIACPFRTHCFDVPFSTYEISRCLFRACDSLIDPEHCDLVGYDPPDQVLHQYDRGFLLVVIDQMET